MNWYLYIARTRTGRFYTGISTDPALRLERHNAGLGSRMAKQQGPFELVYISPPFLTLDTRSFVEKTEARRREIQVKDWSQTKKLKLISGEFS